MTQETLGARIACLRKEKNWTQDILAEKLNVSPQAVSKWENDQSCPDIMLLPELARVLDTTADYLLSGAKPHEIQLVPEAKRKKLEEMMMRIYVLEDGKEQVRISTPLMLLKIAIDAGIQAPMTFSQKNDRMSLDLIKGIDFENLIHMVESGLIGTLMEVDTNDGTSIRIVVE